MQSGAVVHRRHQGPAASCSSSRSHHPCRRAAAEFGNRHQRVGLFFRVRMISAAVRASFGRPAAACASAISRRATITKRGSLMRDAAFHRAFAEAGACLGNQDSPIAHLVARGWAMAFALSSASVSRHSAVGFLKHACVAGRIGGLVFGRWSEYGRAWPDGSSV